MKLLMTAEFDPEQLRRLEQHFQVRTAGWGKERRLLSEEELIDLCQDAEVLVVEAEKVSEVLLRRCPTLRAIGVCRGSRLPIDQRILSGREVVVFSAPGRNAIAVADFTIGLLLALCRHIGNSWYLLKQGRYLNPDPVCPSDWTFNPEAQEVTYELFKGPELEGKSIGLIGFGNIGRRVAQRASGFGMSVLAHDPFLSEHSIRQGGALAVSMDELLRQADFVSLHASYVSENFHLISHRQLQLMKPTAFLINVSQGSLLDEDALYAALKERRIAGAALDVMEQEPPRADHPLLRLDNVLITPHLAGASWEVVKHHSKMITDQLLAWMETS